MGNYKIPDSRINSPGRHFFRRSPREARLNGRLSWCAIGQTYLDIDLGRTFKVTSIATQGGRMDTGDKWVKQYKVAFYAGATRVMYSESGLEKVRNLRLRCKPHIFLSLSLYISVFFFSVFVYLFVVGCKFYKSHMIATLCTFFEVFLSSFQVFRHCFSFKVAIITIEYFNIGFCIVNC